MHENREPERGGSATVGPRSQAGGRVRIAVAAALVLLAPSAPADEFEAELERVDRAIKENPARLPEHALESCLVRRDSAIDLYRAGHTARAERALRYCVDVLHVSEAETAVPARSVHAPSMEEIQAQAAREVEKALALAPNVERGLKIYRSCAMCHMPEGWGLSNGSVPQIAGQHRKVVVKQLADIRAGNRDNWLMLPYSSVESIGGAQAVADVAGYIDTLEISVETGKGSGKDLDLGERLYRENCTQCHGPSGEGNDEEYVPRIQSQHYEYLVRQLEAIRDRKRRNANPDMVVQVQRFGEHEIRALSDYVSRLEPPPELQAPRGWHNPDFTGPAR